MTVTVNFRGPILFVHDGKSSTDVRIPDCTKTIRHLDDTDAAPHYAGIMLLPHDGSGPRYTALDKAAELTVTAANMSGNSNADLLPSFDDKVAFDLLVSAGGSTGNELKLGPIGSSALIARVILKGGELGAGRSTPSAVSIPYRLGSASRNARLPLLTTWTCAGAAKITGVAADFDLVDGDDVYFFNWEVDRPTQEELDMPMEPSAGQHMEPEADFKWLYTLLIPPNGWADWITKAGGVLPAPNSTIHKAQERAALTTDAFFPPNSACDGARWQEPPPP